MRVTGLPGCHTLPLREGQWLASLRAQGGGDSVGGVFKISEFSRLTRVSIKTLRHYDRIGLLPPAVVDPRTRYRHYAARQAPRLYRILALRELGFSLSSIADILGRRANDAAMRRVLERRGLELRRTIDVEQKRLAQVEAVLGELGLPGRRTAQPVLRSLPAIRVAARRRRVADLESGAQELFEAVERDAARARIRAGGAPLLIYHDPDHRERQSDIEACVPVIEGARPARGVRVRTLAAVSSAACVAYLGSYRRWAEVARGLLAWLERRELAVAGPLRESYLQFGAEGCEELNLPRQYLAEGSEEQVTEMQIPVAEKRR